MNDTDNKIHTPSNPSSKQEEIQKIIDEQIAHIIEKERQEQLHSATSHSTQNKTASVRQRFMQKIRLRLKNIRDAFGKCDKL